LGNRDGVRRKNASVEPTGCPLTAALRAIGGKWNLICLYWLEIEPRRFNELRRLMPDISHKVLTESLRSLEDEGLVTRTVRSRTPSHVVYAMSPYGESVKPLIDAVRQWGRVHLTRDTAPPAAARRRRTAPTGDDQGPSGNR
jgi:DNA-binding HxlR family transcriptional regulator